MNYPPEELVLQTLQATRDAKRTFVRVGIFPEVFHALSPHEKMEFFMKHRFPLLPPEKQVLIQMGFCHFCFGPMPDQPVWYGTDPTCGCLYVGLAGRKR